MPKTLKVLIKLKERKSVFKDVFIAFILALAALASITELISRLKN